MVAAQETTDLSQGITDAKLKAAVQQALADGKLSDAEVNQFIRIVLERRSQFIGLLQQQGVLSKMKPREYLGLLSLLQESLTMSDGAKRKIRMAILKEYDPFRFKNKSIAAAVRAALADDTLSQAELKQIVSDAVAVRQASGSTSSVGTPGEIYDLLRILYRLGDPWMRRFVHGALLRITNPKGWTPTVADRFELSLRDEGGPYKLEVRLLTDGHTSGASKTEFTRPMPGYQAVPDGRQFRIIEWPRVTRIDIRTLFGTGQTRNMTSSYGRGTTPQDIRQRDTSLGFHEAMHQRDYINTLKSEPFPTYQGQAVASRSAIQSAYQRYRSAVQGYYDRMEANSVKNTDEVGYTLAEFKRHGSAADFYDRESARP